MQRISFSKLSLAGVAAAAGSSAVFTATRAASTGSVDNDGGVSSTRRNASHRRVHLLPSDFPFRPPVLRATTMPSPVASLQHARRWQSSVSQKDFSHITHDLVWGLWNEGNLFSLSAPELIFFLQQQQLNSSTTGGAAGGTWSIDPQAKKSTLVRQVEELLSAEQANLTVPQETANVVMSGYDRVEETLDEADEYGDWGAEPGFEERRHIDYMEFSPQMMGERYEPLVPRAYQLLHSNLSADVGLNLINPSKLPGQSKNTLAYLVSKVDVDKANEQHFRRGLEWCMANLWNTNMNGELNIGAGRILFYRSIAKQNRNALPLWALQKHVYAQHPYVWFAIASSTNAEAMEKLANQLGMKLVQDTTTSYKLSIRRAGEILDAELNAQLQCTKLNRPWDRFLVSHFVRAQMPDLRFLVRARHPIKKRIADAYLEADILRSTRDSVQSVLSPELGDVNYCCERVIRKWAMRTQVGVTLQLVETRRTPLIITRAGDEGERLEYEWIVVLPQKAERVDIAAMSSELWRYGSLLAKELETGMEEFLSHTMTSVAAF
ncbi:putative mitochondrial guide RNA associated protein, GAP1 [Leptomonas pyrrhocoris]|uniref:Putative mitochondrial guide RNA associated protein, GAP1 n=1 Tax=Leptomonas pyrrhocoris TaxID=157538 RepID=A0A0N0VGZ5_LEPPY|nr:putative mitochondrial guide RNA associated protein, GAP1 [Leptomonas pyrrhocoris]XP_015662800.1 putative mitochondrial guide RNA associated protein, GAP1 [Leptomonas pyrrhocoris]KPA84360.1 putative mitochondrial guide RNA associated protein, GAP1 [Leptomonas pyrrhocoris]KPA84361.1 putative mitochondrial guide RNA associated protein, GAP1 [Leptomonas pyrrhocoris]|eukprot:XP_015662799.1 putative mitochondrial guide RNA associated protein, GAP1 [Leptomonas pyrrhocoris]